MTVVHEFVNLPLCGLAWFLGMRVCKGYHTFCSVCGFWNKKKGKGGGGSSFLYGKNYMYIIRRQLTMVVGESQAESHARDGNRLFGLLLHA